VPSTALGVKRPGREAEHIHLVPRSRNTWSYTSTPQHTFMAWCSVKKTVEGQIYLYLTRMRRSVQKRMRRRNKKLHDANNASTDADASESRDSLSRHRRRSWMRWRPCNIIWGGQWWQITSTSSSCVYGMRELKRIIQVKVSCIVTPRSVVAGCQRFGGPCCLHLQREDSSRNLLNCKPV
jgi:hypothetical protein